MAVYVECSHGNVSTACPRCRMTSAELKADFEAKNKPKKPQNARKKHPVDRIAQMRQEYALGLRCYTCETLRDHRGMCLCDRRMVLDQDLQAAEEFETLHGDPESRKHQTIHAAAASARKRSVLRAGLRELPSPDQPDIPIARAVNLSARVSEGNALDWRANSRPSGDELPL